MMFVGVLQVTCWSEKPWDEHHHHICGNAHCKYNMAPETWNFPKRKVVSQPRMLQGPVGYVLGVAPLQ